MQWLRNGIPIPNATSQFLLLTSISAADVGSYTLTVTNSFGSASSGPVAISIIGAPAIQTQPQGQTVNSGANATLQVGASGASPLNYQWQFNGASILNATNAIFSLNNAQVAHAGSYTVVVSNAIGSVTSAPPAVLNVSASIPGPVVAWGQNTYGQTNIPAGLSGVAAIAGGLTTVVLRTDGTVLAWGYNDYGQTNVPLGLSGVTAIAAGLFHTVALKSNGTVVAWGNNDSGQTNVPSGLSGVKAVAGGARHTVALKSNGTVVAWGYLTQDSVPTDLADVTAIAAGLYHTVALKSDGTLVAWGINLSGQTNVPVGLSGVTAIAAGDHTLALKNDGTVVAWGYNFYGATNVPVGLTGVSAIAAGRFHSVALKTNGTVVAWGYNNFGQTSVPAGLSGVVAVAAGGDNTVALIGTGPVVTAISIGNNLTLLWPDTATGYRVESALRLTPTVAWNNVTGTFQTNGGSISIVMPMSGPQKFYRLIKP